jgi:hypothetical protein
MKEGDNMSDNDLKEGLKRHYGSDVISGKGGFWVKGHGFHSTAKARSVTGLPGKKRTPRARQGAWGDYATVAMLNRPRKSRVFPLKR